MAIAHDGDPFDLFGEWYAGAEDCGLNEPSAVTLATAVLDESRVMQAMIDAITAAHDRGRGLHG